MFWALEMGNNPSYTSRFAAVAFAVPSPRLGFGGLSRPKTKLQASPNRNMKHCKSVEFLSNFGMPNPPIEDFMATVLCLRGWWLFAVNIIWCVSEVRVKPTVHLHSETRTWVIPHSMQLDILEKCIIKPFRYSQMSIPGQGIYWWPRLTLD